MNENEFLVLNIRTNNISLPTISLYFPEIKKKVKEFSLKNKEYYDFFIKKCESTKKKIIYYQESSRRSRDKKIFNRSC